LRQVKRQWAARAYADADMDGSWEGPTPMLQGTDPRPLVLIIDDDLAVRESLAMVMEAFGFRTQTAMNGIEGLEAVDAETPSAIITDLQMPGMNGLELLTALRRTSTGIPVIVISGGDIEMARQMRADAAFHKPLAVFEMIDTVSNLTRAA
jgi:FixJ family two-component response regulator